MILPWLVFNVYHYHALTGTREHVDFVKRIVNPNQIDLGLEFVIQKIPYLFYSFWVPQEVQWSGIYDVGVLLVNGLSFCLGLVFLIGLYQISRNLKSHLFFEDSTRLLLSLFYLLTTLSIVLLVYGTTTQDVDVLIGRYLYILVIPFIVISYRVFITILNIEQLFSYRLLLIFVATFLSVAGLTYYATGNHNVIEYLLKRNQNQVELKNLSQAKEQGIFKNKELGNIPRDLANQLNERDYKEKIPLNNEYAAVNDLTSEKNSLLSVGSDPYVIWRSESMVMKAGDMLLLQVEFTGENRLLQGQVFWEDDHSGFLEEKSYHFMVVNGKMLVPVGFHNDWKEGYTLRSLRFDIEQLNPNDKITIYAPEIIRF